LSLPFLFSLGELHIPFMYSVVPPFGLPGTVVLQINNKGIDIYQKCSSITYQANTRAQDELVNWCIKKNLILAN